jgi:hypothetical protein
MYAAERDIVDATSKSQLMNCMQCTVGIGSGDELVLRSQEFQLR